MTRWHQRAVLCRSGVGIIGIGSRDSLVAHAYRTALLTDLPFTIEASEHTYGARVSDGRQWVVITL